MTFVYRTGCEQDLMRHPDMVRGLARAGRAVQTEAERTAPRLASLPKDRERFYADMFDTTAGHDSRGRAMAAVNNRHFIALWVEFGTVHNKPHAVLRRALDTTRGRLR